jgi:DNA-3-methyladenine glycosylase
VLYVYFTYGMHDCVNVVCGPAGEASAVLLRAGEVVHGVDVAHARRPTARRDVDLARGPARLAGALGLSRADDGAVIGAGRIGLLVPERPPGTVLQGPRVGVAGPGGVGDDFPWRFWLAGEPTVSPYRPAVPRRRRGVGPSAPDASPGPVPSAGPAD